MATSMQEMEILTPGMDQNHPEMGQYYQNVYYKNGALTVRPGFGQLAEYDTTLGMPEVTRDGVHESGYYKHLGSHAILTNFGHEQIVSVHSSSCYTGDHDNRGAWTKLYVVNIYDIATGERWEEVVSRHTSERSVDVSPLTEWRGIYETNKDSEYGGLLYASDSNVFFEESNDALFFGSREMGFRVYIPSDFNTNRCKQVNGTTSVDAAPPYSETSIIIPVAPADGQFKDADVYLSSATMPDPIDAASLGSRMAIARDRDVFFSDEGRPASFMALNTISIPSEMEITAIESVNDNLMIFTELETFLYQPNTGGALISAGRVSSVSRSVGCIGPSAITKAEGSIVWLDKNGVYSSSGRMDINKISGPIQPFFDDSISNPLSHYAASDNISNTQPRSFFDSRDLSDANMAYEPGLGMIMLSVPSQSIVWVFQANNWLLWNFESIVNNNEVGVKSGISNAAILSVGNNIYLVGGLDTYTSTEATRLGVASISKTNSFYILEFGRGGGLDRSVHEIEDKREFTGHYSNLAASSPAATNGTAFYIEKPVKLRKGFYPNITDDVYMVPISFTIPYEASSPQVRDLKLNITIDNSILTPFAEAPTTLPSIEYFIPSERFGSQSGWADISLSGNILSLHWSSVSSMNLAYGRKNPLIFIPMKAVKTTDDHVYFGANKAAGNEVSYTDQTGAVKHCELYFWNQFVPKIGGKHVSDATSQPVDWVLKSGQIKIDDSKQIRLRTIYSKAMTSGQVDSIPAKFTSNTKLMNVVLSADWKDYVGRANDFTSNGGIRTENNSTSERNREKKFSSTATWNDSILVDDEQYDTLASSQSVKGEHVSVMTFGHVRDKAEGLTVDSIKACYREAGGRRRKGR